MKKLLVSFSVFAFAGMLFAQRSTELNNPGPHVFPAKNAAGPPGGAGGNLVYHTGGQVIQSAKVVMIFWGPSFASGGADNGYATQLENFRDLFGQTGEYNVITQYYDSTAGKIAKADLGYYGHGGDWFDTTNALPGNGNVTDALVQCEVQAYFLSSTSSVTCSDFSVKSGSGIGFPIDHDAIYEVFIPATNGSTNVYSSSGSSDSCGGPNLAYCAYHGYYGTATELGSVKYSIEPYPSCSGCQWPGFSDVQNQEHFVCHETREAVTDENLNAWFDHRGYEADDKCAWSPAPFIDPSTGFAYQYEWANNVSSCVQTQ